MAVTQISDCMLCSLKFYQKGHGRRLILFLIHQFEKDEMTTYIITPLQQAFAHILHSQYPIYACPVPLVYYKRFK